MQTLAMGISVVLFLASVAIVVRPRFYAGCKRWHALAPFAGYLLFIFLAQHMAVSKIDAADALWHKGDKAAAVAVYEEQLDNISTTDEDVYGPVLDKLVAWSLETGDRAKAKSYLQLALDRGYELNGDSIPDPGAVVALQEEIAREKRLEQERKAREEQLERERRVRENRLELVEDAQDDGYQFDGSGTRVAKEIHIDTILTTGLLVTEMAEKVVDTMEDVEDHALLSQMKKVYITFTAPAAADKYGNEGGTVHLAEFVIPMDEWLRYTEDRRRSGYHMLPSLYLDFREYMHRDLAAEWREDIEGR